MNKLKKLISGVNGFIRKCTEDDVPVFASQASFFMIFSTIPFVMLLITLLKYVVPISLDEMLDMLSFYVPSELMQYFSAVMIEIFDKSVSASGSISVVTAISTLWLASKSVLALYTGTNRIYRPDVSIGYIKSRSLSIVYTIMFILVIVATIVVFGFGKSIEALIYDKLPVFIPIVDLVLKLRMLVFIVVLTLVFASFYKLLTHTDMSFSMQFPGAVFASAGWMIFSWIYSLYIHYVSNYSYVYGSLAALVFLMLWLYICMIIFLCGAELNKLINIKRQVKKQIV